MLIGFGKYCGGLSPRLAGVLKLEAISQYSGSPTNRTTKKAEMLTPLMNRCQPVRLRLRMTSPSFPTWTRKVRSESRQPSSTRSAVVVATAAPGPNERFLKITL